MRSWARTVGVVALALAVPASAAGLRPLKVSANGRYLVHDDGTPFFWLGDTAWHMLGKSVREDTTNQPSVSLYFRTRAAQGFTVIQSVIVREFRGGGGPKRNQENAYGHVPFVEGDASRPALGPGEFDDFWDHIGWCIEEAARHGLRIAALPVWLNDVEDDDPLARDPTVAYRYGRFLGSRWGRAPVIWVMGGDAYQKGRNVDTPSRLALVRAMAEGIADGATGADAFDGRAAWDAVLITFHPPGGDKSSATWLHDEPWLDFNMVQTTTRFSFENWRTVMRDFARTPPKPVLDAEVAYEESLSLRQTERQDIRIRPWDVRRAAWWNVLAGGFGHTYGHRSFIGWIRKGETYRWGAHIPWYERLHAPGATQMIHLRRLVEETRFHDHRPAMELLEGEAGEGDAHIQVGASADGSVAIVYSPMGRPIRFRADRFGRPAEAFWYDPRTGAKSAITPFPAEDPAMFTPPSSGEEHDWVLVVRRR
ncbi:MAG: glycoside hydrolase family 140 protein [Kiritimatiellae bacterium]|nr:glycoside hydrolase family 140 protein [Kiritimatiellia bacterium]